MGAAQTAASGTSLLLKPTSGQASQILQAPGFAESALSAPRNPFKTILTDGTAPIKKPKLTMRDPLGASRGQTTAEREQISVRDLKGVPTRKDAASPKALAAGQAEIAAISLTQEVVLGLVADTAWEIAGTGDFNGDGNTDILWRYYGTGLYQGFNDIWFMNGTTFLSEMVFSQVADTAWRIVGTGDFNGDQQTDILWRYYGTGPYQGLNDIWYMNGTSLLEEAVFSQVMDTDWKIVGTGDFNADGMTDILWRNHGTGPLQGVNDIWYMNGTTFVSEAVFSLVLDTAWEIAGVGDFNGDQNLDILWRYYGGGAFQGLNVVWYMNGAAFVSEEIFSAVTDTTWRIVNR
jgi:hypothetical protein